VAKPKEPLTPDALPSADPDPATYIASEGGTFEQDLTAPELLKFRRLHAGLVKRGQVLGNGVLVQTRQHVVRYLIGLLPES